MGQTLDERKVPGWDQWTRKITGPLKNIYLSDNGFLVILALARILLQLFTNAQYGFFRDELATLDDARHISWGYVAYPPVTPFLGRIAMEIFGLSLNGVRFFSVAAEGLILLLAGLMVKAMGGKRWAQIVAALAVATTPASVVGGTMLQYATFDYVAWVLTAYFVIRLLVSENPRWWLAIGSALGYGVLTKYIIGFLVVGLLAGLLLTPNRRYLTNPWFWGGNVITLLIALPNLIWQIQHHFVSLAFLNQIHARDVLLGRGSPVSFLIDQIKMNFNPITLLLFVAGIFFCWFNPAGKRYRMLGWMYLMPFLLFLLMKGRGYYLAPAYPMLVAAGAIEVEGWFSKRSERQRWKRSINCILAAGIICVAICVLPVAPVNSRWWNLTSSLNENLKDEIGWPDLAQTVANIYVEIPAPQKQRTYILACSGGVNGAINLYGPEYRLPAAISGSNSCWERGLVDPSPQTLIAVGFSRESLESVFTHCELAGRITNRFRIQNQLTKAQPFIYTCRGLRARSWPEFWSKFQYFE